MAASLNSDMYHKASTASRLLVADGALRAGAKLPDGDRKGER